MRKILGIDEAGRGPVIGPLVMCGVLCEELKLNKLKKVGVKDSKLLTPERRETLVPIIKNIISDFKIIKIPPDVLDNNNLNELELKTSADLINALKPQKVILDTPVPYSKANEYCAKIKKLISCQKPDILGEPHADTNYPIVGAASILAKVERDAEIKKLHKKYGDFGSGYPADPKTYEFIKQWNRFPEIVRRKWDTCKEILVTPGKIMVLGDVDTGKTEFCRFLVNSGLEKKYTVGVLDLDIGQSHIGPPGSLGFGIAKKRVRNLEKVPAEIIYPVGALSPTGITEHIVSTLKTMLPKIPESVDFLVVDTTGYICTDEALNLKLQKINLINPDRIVIIEEDNELEGLVKRLDATRVYRFPVNSKAKPKSIEKRTKFREQSAKKYNV